MNTHSNIIRLCEVGPRDGLQNEKNNVPTQAKIAFVNQLSQMHPDEIEVSAFVSPQWVPQLADATEVFQGIERVPGIIYSALVPNEYGLEKALRVGVDKVSVFTAASHTFTQKNVNATIDETFKRFEPVVAKAKREKLLVRGYVSTAFWCPYEGYIEPERAAAIAKRLLELGVDDVSMGDTIGKAIPDEVIRVCEALQAIAPLSQFAMHFHDTYGRGVANALASYHVGIRSFDASVGGLGGCPYAPGAKGNVSTRALLEALIQEGAQTHVNVQAACTDAVASYLS